MSGARPLILMYHRVGDATVDPHRLSVSARRFADHIEIIAQRRQPLPLAELARALGAGTLANDAIAVTFDDGYAANIPNAVPALCQHGVPATMFVTSGYIGGAHEFWWDELDRIFPAAG